MDTSYVELFNSLESHQPHIVEDAKKQFHSYFNSVKEPWLMYGMFDTYMSTNSVRIIEIFVGVREPHEQYLFDRLTESLKSSQYKLQSLTLLGHIVTKNPTWMYKIVKHTLMKELFRFLKNETEIIPLMSALLTVIILLPIVAGYISPHLHDIFEVFSRLAAWNTKNPSRIPEGQLLHLQVALYALFNRLYGMFPGNFLNHLRVQYSIPENKSIFMHTILPMLDTVKMHPLLVTASKEKEIASARWKTLEANDVIIECAKFTVDNGEKAREDFSFRGRTPSLRSRSSLDYMGNMFGDVKPVTGVGSKSSGLADGDDTWSPTVFCGGNHTPPGSAPTSIPHTPISQVSYVLSCTLPQQEGTSPPEAAVEATPESTPVKDLHVGRERVVQGSSVVNNLNSSFLEGSQPSSPMRKDSAFFKNTSSSPLPDSKANHYSLARVHKMYLERSQAQKESRGSPQRVNQLEKLEDALSQEGGSYDQEDKEVEDTLSHEITSNPGAHSLPNPSQPVEVGGGWPVECSNLRGDGCSEGGLHMADSRYLQQFTSRLRFYSHCLPDRHPTHILSGLSSGSSPGEDSSRFSSDVQVRRAVSCPEMKKATGSSISAELSCSALDETLEEEDQTNLNGHSAQVELNVKNKMVDSMVQTEEAPVLGYEHLFLSLLPIIEQPSVHSAPPDVTCPPLFSGDNKFSPYTALENYIEAASKSCSKTQGELSDVKSCKEQIALLMLQLQFERHRREVHAERNRRLLGKSRANSALEEHNNALKDQVALLQKDIEILRSELDKFKQDSKFSSDKILQNVIYWQERSFSQEKENKDLLSKYNLLEEELKKQDALYNSLNKEYSTSQALVFELENSLRSAVVAASASKGVREELCTLQQRLTNAGENEAKLLTALDKVILGSKKASEAVLATHSYQNHVQELKIALDAKLVALDSTKARVVEMESDLRKKDVIISKQKELIQRVKDEHSTQIKSLERTCEELRKINMKQEENSLELLQRVETLEMSGRKSQAQSSPPLSASLSSSGTLSLSDPAPIKNLQLLVDTFETPRASSARDHPSPL